MEKKLLIGILGSTNSGRTYTWNNLFRRNVITGKNIRKLYLNDHEYVNVFLINGSPQERKRNVNEIIKKTSPRIVLCSLHYGKGIYETLDYFIKNDYFLYILWLNPGYKDPHDKTLFYNVGIINKLLTLNSIIGIRNGKGDVTERIREIREYIYGWAKCRNLVWVKYKSRRKKKPEKDDDVYRLDFS